MTFLSPISLIAFLPIAAAIIVLYLLKLRRKEREVSSIMLWQDAVADIQANAPFQKLKKSLLLLLQLIALACLVIAFARPLLRVKGVGENRIVVIIDSSASMQSLDVSPSRFGSAKSKALKIVKSMGPGDTMLVVTAGAKARVVSSFTSDKRALASAITSLRPSDGSCNMRQAMVLALSLVSGKSAAPPRIAVFSDGGFAPLSDLSAANAELDFVQIGSSCDNVAITGLDSRKTLSGEQQVLIGVKNFSSRSHSFSMELYLKDQLLDIREEVLAPGQVKQEILSDLPNTGGRVTAKLDLSDDLAADNTGSVYLAARRKLSVLLVSKGNVFLQNALNLDPRTTLTRADAPPANLSEQKYDVIVFDRTRPPSDIPAGGYLLIDTSASNGPATPGKSTKSPVVIASDAHSQVGAYVDFSGIRMAGCTYLSPKSWAATVVDGDDGALCVCGARNGRKFVQLAFNLLESDFPLRVGFPIFVTNCLDYLAPAGSSSAGDVVRAGSPASIDVPPGVREVTICDPNGNKHTQSVVQTPFIYDSTDTAGIYTISAKNFTREFACNLSSALESNTTPKNTVIVGDKRITSSGRAVSTNTEYFWPLILGALVMLAFEWYAYHRRL